MDNTDPNITFDDDGACNWWNDYHAIVAGQPDEAHRARLLEETLRRIKLSRGSNQFDCILGLSGGVDSSYMAYLAKTWGLNPLIVHFDNGWNDELAVHNIEVIVRKLDFRLNTFVMNWPEFRDLQRAYFKASVLDLEVPTDHMIFGALHQIANEQGIRHVLSGNNFATEWLLPPAWYHSKFDLENIKGIHRAYGELPMKNLPKLGVWQRLYYQRVKLIQDIRILDLVPYRKISAKQLLSDEFGWKDYGGKHYESVFTRFYQGYILPTKYGIDKRKAHLSNLICNGEITRDEALAELAKPTYDPEKQRLDKSYVAKKLGWTEQEFEEILARPPRRHEEFGTDDRQTRGAQLTMTVLRPVAKLRRAVSRARGEYDARSIEGFGERIPAATRLAVFTSQLGASFINRHVADLLPGRTIAVARYQGHPLGGFWRAPCPVLFLDRWSLDLGVRLARRAGLDDTALREAAIKRFLRRNRVTVVLGEYLDQFVDFVPLLDRMGLPYIVQGHGIDLSASLRTPGMADRYRAYHSALAVLTRCEFHRRRLIELGLPADRIHVNPGGVDVPARLPARPADASNRFLAVGRMATKKGPIYSLEAFRLAAAQNPDITLDFIGDGPLFPAARQFVDACGLAHRVRLHRYESEETKERLLLECGVFIQHSITDPDTGDEEGLPAAIQEAMAHGLAVVSTRHSGIPEAVIDGVTGILVNEGDVRQMAAAMLEVPRMASVFGSAGHLRAVSQHAWVCEQRRLIAWLADAPVSDMGPARKVSNAHS